MGIATSLRNAARNLIATFGNSATLYSYSSATKATNDEGEVTVSNWKTGTTILVVDEKQGQEILKTEFGWATTGSDDKIIRDDVSVSNNDRVTYRSKEYRVTKLDPVLVEDTVVIQMMELSEVTGISVW